MPEIRSAVSSPSLRGSGLKWAYNQRDVETEQASPSLRGSGLKSLVKEESLVATASPSLRGSGLK